MRNGRRFNYVLSAIVIVTILLLSACGGDSQENVGKKIEKQLSQVDGYKAQAEMIMKTGQEERKYDIDIWYQKADAELYRVDLANEADDHRQTILKNEEGVFVLTPILNKSFKFQSDWPEKNGQPYLYQSLIQDIVEDNEAVFTTHDDYYMYKTKTNYMNNKQLPYQHVYFNKKTYLPMYVQVLDESEEPLIEVKFTAMDVNPTFTEADFNREAILGAANHEDSGDEAESEDTESEETIGREMSSELPLESAELLLPAVTKGADLVETEEVTGDESTRTIMTFKGERNFTLIQEQGDSMPAMSTAPSEMRGELVHLGHSIGAVTNDMIEWNYKGRQFYLASEELTIDELIDVASSVYSKSVK